MSSSYSSDDSASASSLSKDRDRQTLYMGKSFRQGVITRVIVFPRLPRHPPRTDRRTDDLQRTTSLSSTPSRRRHMSRRRRRRSTVRVRGRPPRHPRRTGKVLLHLCPAKYFVKSDRWRGLPTSRRWRIIWASSCWSWRGGAACGSCRRGAPGRRPGPPP